MDDAAICYECIAHELRCRLLVDGNAAVKVLCTVRILTARYLSIRKPDVIRKVHDSLIAFQWIPSVVLLHSVDVKVRHIKTARSPIFLQE